MKKVNTKVNQKGINETIKSLQSKSISRSKGFQLLFENGLSVNEIHKLIFQEKILNGKEKQICYNNVYNVISNYIRVNDIEFVKELNQGVIKSKIIELHLEGHSLTSINKMTKTNYNYIWKVVNEYKLAHLEGKEEVQ